MAPEPPFDLEKGHKWFAIECNNAAWDALESDDELDDVAQRQVVQQAHASSFHWSKVGHAVNQIRALYLVAHAEVVFGTPAAALRFAHAVLRMSEIHSAELTDWDLAFIHDAAARAYDAVAREGGEYQDEAARHNELALEHGKKIKEDSDRSYFETWYQRRR